MDVTRGSRVVSSADDVLEMNVVHWVICLGELCGMCMYLPRGWVGGVRGSGG